MDRHGTLAAQEELQQPSFDARFGWSQPQFGAPAANLWCRYALDRTAEALTEGGTQLALRADEPDQQAAAPSVHFMKSVWPDPDRRTLRPSFLRRTAYSKRPAERHQQLDAVMTVGRGREARAPDDLHLWPWC